MVFTYSDVASATTITTLANVPEKSVTTTSNRLRMLPPATPDLACFQALRVLILKECSCTCIAVAEDAHCLLNNAEKAQGQP